MFFLYFNFFFDYSTAIIFNLKKIFSNIYFINFFVGESVSSHSRFRSDS